MELIYEILGLLLFGAITIGIWLGIFQDLNLRKKHHDKEMEELNLRILRLQQAISNDKEVTLETINKILKS